MIDVFFGLMDVFFAGVGVLERFLLEDEDFFSEDMFFFLVGVLERFGVLEGVVDFLRDERRTGILLSHVHSQFFF